MSESINDNTNTNSENNKDILTPPRTSIPSPTSEFDQKGSDFEKLKLVYEKVSEQHRFYLAWRQYLLAGYFAVLAALFYAVFQLYNFNNDFVRYYSVNIAIVIPFVSLFFMWLDDRNRILYQKTQKVGAAIEKKLDLDLEYNDQKLFGLFDSLDNSYKSGKGFISHMKTHTWTIRIFFAICSGVGIYLAVTLH